MDESKYQDVLGTHQAKGLGVFYGNNLDVIKKLRQHILFSYCENSNFTSQEYEAFREGAMSWELAMAKCLEELEAEEVLTEDE